MNHSLIACAFALTTSIFGSAHADESNSAMELAKESGCLTCHSITEKIVGPAYQDVSAKYANDPDAVATLTQSVRNGVIGKWSKRVPMPPHPNLSNEDLDKLVRWVLSQKK